MPIKRNGVPIYLQIAHNLREKIINGEYKLNSQIPTEEELAEHYGVSRMTARNAVTHLLQQGLIYRVHGKGTFVSATKLERNLNKLNNFYEDIIKLGMTPSAKLLNMEKRLPTQKEQQVLEINKNQYVYDVTRIRYVNEDPLGYQNFIIPLHFVPELEKVDLEKGSLYKYLKDCGHHIYKAEQRMEAVLAPEIAKLMNLPKEQPFFYFERVSYLKDGTPIEILKSHFYGEKYSFNITLYS